MSTNKKVDMEDSADNTPTEKAHQTGVTEYLSDLGIAYQFCSCSKQQFFSGTPETLYVRAVMLEDSFGPLLVILLAQDILDYPNLCKTLSRDLEWVDPEQGQYQSYYNQDVKSFPPLAEIFGMKALIDDRIALQWHLVDKVVFVAGSLGKKYISIAAQDFIRIQDSVWESNFSHAMTGEENPKFKQLTESNLVTIEQSFCLRRMGRRIRETFELPIMPPMVDELLKLRVDPTAGAEDLARLVSQDPILAAQAISWACSPYYGYPGKINCVKDAIIKVLGYELVMNISLGVAIGQIMRMPANGPLGLKAYWKHSLYAASLIEKIVGIMPVETKPHKGLAYLCALLHNFGYLLLGQLFLPQYFVLGQLVILNPQCSILVLEQLLYQTNHQELGSLLMSAWNMPEELIISVSYHHDVNYKGENCVYPNLVLLVNVLLKQHGMGDESLNELPECILTRLKLDKQEVQDLFDEFWKERASLDDIVKLLAS